MKTMDEGADDLWINIEIILEAVDIIRWNMEDKDTLREQLWLIEKNARAVGKHREFSQ